MLRHASDEKEFQDGIPRGESGESGENECVDTRSQRWLVAT